MATTSTWTPSAIQRSKQPKGHANVVPIHRLCMGIPMANCQTRPPTKRHRPLPRSLVPPLRRNCNRLRNCRSLRQSPTAHAARSPRFNQRDRYHGWRRRRLLMGIHIPDLRPETAPNNFNVHLHLRDHPLVRLTRLPGLRQEVGRDWSPATVGNVSFRRALRFLTWWIEQLLPLLVRRTHPPRL